MPALSFAPALLLKAQGRGLGVKAAIFDVDGVLTDGRLFMASRGRPSRPSRPSMGMDSSC